RRHTRCYRDWSSDVCSSDLCPRIVRFNDGTEGTVELADFLSSASTGVFATLRNERVFRQARITLGAVTWPGELGWGTGCHAPGGIGRASCRERGESVVCGGL